MVQLSRTRAACSVAQHNPHLHRPPMAYTTAALRVLLLLLGCQCNLGRAAAEAMPYSSLLLNTPGQWPPYVRGKDQYKFVLNPRALSKGIGYQGPNERLRVVLDRWRQGQKLVMAAVGGSITQGHGCKDAPAYPRYLENYLFDNYGNVELTNGGLGGTMSSYMELCHTASIPQNADLIIVEYSQNDPAFASPPFENDPRRAYERLIRKLLSYPRKPAVLVMQAYHWRALWRSTDYPLGAFWNSAQLDHDTVAQYYQLPILSVKTCCYHLLREQSLGFWRNVTRDMNPEGLSEKAFFADKWHPDGKTGSRVMGELLINLVEQTLASLKAVPINAGDKAAVDLPLPPPMIPNNHHSVRDQCFANAEFPSVVTRNVGFVWTLDHTTAPFTKPGMVTTQPGSFLEVTVDTRSKTAAGSRTTVHLAYLRSTWCVGDGEATCVSGCTCQPVRLPGHHNDGTNQLHTADIPLTTQHENCTVRITALNSTETGMYRFKVSACTVSEEVR